MKFTTMVHEMYDSCEDDLGIERISTVPPTPMDNPLFDFDKKAQDSNRLPARVLEKDWIRKVSTGNVQIVDDFGNPATLQKDVPVEIDDDEPVELSKELLAEIEKISGYNARAAWSSVRRFLTKSVAQPMAKRASSATFCGHSELGALDPNFDEGRKVLSVERRGKAKITKFEGGERWEIVED